MPNPSIVDDADVRHPIIPATLSMLVARAELAVAGAAA